MKTIDIRRCSRCGLNHSRLEVHDLSNPADEFKQWTTCPVTNQPILIRECSDDEVQNLGKIAKKYKEVQGPGGQVRLEPDDE